MGGWDDQTNWFKPQGVYGETERATYRPEMRSASSLEHRRLSKQPFVYFVPFLPLAVCPDVPDALAEYCQSVSRSVEIVYWKLDSQLMPSLLKRDIDTAVVFGIAGQDGPEFLNFANGIVLQDAATKTIYRLFTSVHKLIEPTVSRSRPAEKILADSFNLHVLNLQSPEYVWSVKEATPPTHLLVTKGQQSEPALARMARAFWGRGIRTRIIEG